MPEQIVRRGGTHINGWAIWIWPGVFIEAEHHCVWQKPNGELLDITPKNRITKKVLFLPDPTKEYDYEQEQRLDNIRKPLVDDEDVRTFLELAKSRFLMIEEASKGLGRMVSIDGAKLSALTMRLAKIEHKLMKKYLKPKDPCWCGSNKSFRKCHKSLPNLGNDFATD